MEAWLEARWLAEQDGDRVTLGIVGVNLAGLYIVMGDLDAAASAAERAVVDAEKGGYADGIAGAQIQLAVIRAREGRIEESRSAMNRAVVVAEIENNFVTKAEAWDHLGEELLARGELAEADGALTEAFRLRKMHHLAKLDSCYYNLARLRLAEGDAESALHLVDAALGKGHQPDSLLHYWALDGTRGRILLALGRSQDALNAFRVAREYAKEWRLAVLPADFTRVGSEMQLSQIYSGLIEAGMRLYFAADEKKLARETFEAAEENRAASFHALEAMAGGWREKLPVRYWQSLAKFHADEVKLLGGDDTAVQGEMRGIRAALVEMEAQAGANREPASDGLADRVQANLPGDTALLSFHLGEYESVLWGISRESFRVYALPGRAELAGDVAAFEQSVKTGRADTAARGHALYGKLFGQMDARLQAKPHWILALDGQLFHVPFAALVTGWDESRPEFLLERHSLQVTTGMLGLPQDGRRSWQQVATGKFLGIGDAIYNRADPRWTGDRNAPPFFLPWRTYAATDGSVLARLAGTAAEVESCAQKWDRREGSGLLLLGAEATPGRFQAALEENPTVVHIAAHFQETSQPPHYSMAALTLNAAGEPQWLSPLEITRSKAPEGLVVLSGCSSGSADALPGSGLMGFTRAWLAAGARAVIASHWPTPDDTGTLFVNFYGHFKETPEAGPAVALQRAQLDMLRTGGWRSDPQYWAAYFVNGDL